MRDGNHTYLSPLAPPPARGFSFRSDYEGWKPRGFTSFFLFFSGLVLEVTMRDGNQKYCQIPQKLQLFLVLEVTMRDGNFRILTYISRTLTLLVLEVTMRDGNHSKTSYWYFTTSS